MIAYDKIPNINFVFPQDDQIIVYFDNGEIKALNKNDLTEDIHIREIKKSDVWKNVHHDNFSIFWTKYKLFNSPYSIGHDSVYQFSKPYNQMDVIIKGLRLYKGYTQKDLAEKLNLKTKELSLIEQGKSLNLKLISKILSVLI